MKNIISFMFLFTLLVSGCSQEEILKNQSVSSDSKIFTASFEQNESRTYVEEGNLLRWTEGDQISLFDGNTLNRQYKFDGETGDNAGTFSIVNAPYGSGNDLTANYAVYPYASDMKISDYGVITATLPAEQSYAENSFGLSANTMVAITQDKEDTFLKFKNVGGYLKLQLYGDDVTVKSITLTGNNNEKLAGKATITSAYGQDPTISMAEDATETITLDCEEGVKIGTTAETATAFWLVVPPTTFKNGFVITIKDTNGGILTKSTSNEIAIKRNVIKPMVAFKISTDIPTNQIWYTTEQGNIIAPYKTDAFGVNIISNIYKNGKGIITFDGALTSIGEYAFKNCNEMVSITLPSSVTSIEKYAFQTCSASMIYIKATTPPVIYDSSFNIYFHLSFYVPAESIEAYKKAGYGRSGWSLSADD